MLCHSAITSPLRLESLGLVLIHVVLHPGHDLIAEGCTTTETICVLRPLYIRQFSAFSLHGPFRGSSVTYNF